MVDTDAMRLDQLGSRPEQAHYVAEQLTQPVYAIGQEGNAAIWPLRSATVADASESKKIYQGMRYEMQNVIL
ncbi:hypothetical protein [Enterobacter hormaechei]|uniref:hypothetical protein n=1 Tax=Enterobacter hormaechei TaxID=158836 RepID=UPI002DB7D7EC|nr:hypothetical protein [Enterobacter hormaechei]MEB7375044.1 hypothetical protein [Enterobacter hormaechei]